MQGTSEKKSGCGLLSAFFGRRNVPAKKPATPHMNDNQIANGSTRSSMSNNANNNGTNTRSIQYTKSPGGVPGNPKARKISSEEQAFLESSAVKEPEPNYRTIVAAKPQQQYPQNQNYNNIGYQQGRKVSKEAMTISGELESMIADHQKSRGNAGLVRASSSNVMLHGNLGNLRQPGAAEGVISSYAAGNYQNTHNAATRTTSYETKPSPAAQPFTSQSESGSLCRALSTRMDPETLKIMGNEDYKNGNYAEAIALYDAAISIDSNKASYRSNKSAALTALGRILEAVLECREAIRIEPHYHRAHHRLGNLYLRLGEVEKAIYHFKHSGPEADRDDISKAKAVQTHLNKCTEAKRLRDWNTLVKETANAMSAGADSAPQVYALQAEALLKLHRHQEAEEALSKGPNFDVDSCTKYYGPIGNASFLVVRAQVNMAAGRFDEAMEAIQRAMKLDGNNREASVVKRKVGAVVEARSKGNELFKASRFREACGAYGEGLDHDPRNAVLLCNRAACWSKLRQYDRALEDCTAALHVRPGYAKARLRRADCNARLGYLEASMEDYKILQKETPDNEEVTRGLIEVQQQLKKKHAQES